MLTAIFRYVRETRDEAERRADEYRAVTPAMDSDLRMALVFGTALVCLLLLRFFGQPERPELFLDLLRACGLSELAGELRHALRASPDARLHQRVYWASFRVLLYGIVPALAAVLLLRQPLRELGVRARGIGRHLREYALIMAVIAPIVVIASFGEAFQVKYPYYRVAAGEALWPNFWAWEALYALNFVALEFFFRGFLVHGLAPRFGFGSVFVMMIPYMMIHYGKPLPEAAGSIIAGFVLGTLSLRSCSIWWGAAAHVLVACGMDVLALWHGGRLAP